MVTPLERERNVLKHQMRPLWEQWSAQYSPIEVPDEPGNFVFSEKHARFLADQPDNQIWRIFGQSGDEEFEGYYLEPSGFVGYDGGDAYGYLLTRNPWTASTEEAWSDTFMYLAVRMIVFCDEGCDYEKDCEYCGGVYAVEGSFVSHQTD